MNPVVEIWNIMREVGVTEFEDSYFLAAAAYCENNPIDEYKRTHDNGSIASEILNHLRRFNGSLLFDPRVGAWIIKSNDVSGDAIKACIQHEDGLLDSWVSNLYPEADYVQMVLG